MNKESLGKFIAQTRREKGMTQQTLAEQLHVTNTAVSKWERGICYPDLTLLESLATELDLTISELMACRKDPKETASIDNEEKYFRSLLDISNDSRRRQYNRICLCAAVLLVVAIILTSFVYFYIITNTPVSTYCSFLAKQVNDDKCFVYVEVDGGAHLLRLHCPDQQMYDAIIADKTQRYYVEYRWDQKKYQGTLEYCEAEKQNDLVLGGPMDLMGSTISVNSLLGVDCALKAIKNVYPDPYREGRYLYTFLFYYEGDGTSYFLNEDKMRTNIVTVEDCREAVSNDYDNDGIVELFVLTRYNEEPYLVYDVVDGKIVSLFIDELPPAVLEQLKHNIE